MHTLARFLFASLLNHYVDLAFQVGLRAMRLPVLEECGSGEMGMDNMEMAGAPNNQRDGFVLSRYPRLVFENSIKKNALVVGSLVE